MSEDSSGRGLWICLDGTEGVGKSETAPRLAAEAHLLTAPEFSDSLVGQALHTAVRTTPHLISASPVGQSLAFIADFYEVHQTAVTSGLATGRSVVSDRGYLSKYAYQEEVLSQELGRDAARALLDQVFSHMKPPDLTIHLVAPLDVLRERLLTRDGHCDDHRLEFMARTVQASLDYRTRTPSLHVITVDANRPADRVTADVVAIVQDHLATTRRR